MQALLKHVRSVHSHNLKAPTKQKELCLPLALQKAALAPEYQRHIPFVTCGLYGGAHCAYVDMIIYRDWGAVCLEVDEQQHVPYDAGCAGTSISLQPSG